jgi:hypothetical protein
VTLTLRTRQEGAPPPGKFLGCGICDEVSKRRSFPMGIAASHDLIPTIQTLYRDMNVWISLHVDEDSGEQTIISHSVHLLH